MKKSEFNEILSNRILQIKTVLNNKSFEYATEDRLHNFKIAAQIDNETPIQAAWGMWKKHLVSLKDIKDGILKCDEQMINEKFGDAINYLILMEAIVREGRENERTN